MAWEPLIGREKALRELEDTLLERTKGRRHVFVDGRRKVGKTALLRQFKAQHTKSTVLFVNFEHIVSSPKLFARNFLCQVVGQVQGVEVPYFVGMDELKGLTENAEEAIRQAYHPLMTLLATARPNQVSLLTEVFRLPAKLAEGLGTKVVVLLDNFENLFNLKSYPELKKLEKLVGETLSVQDNVSYAISGTKSVQLGRLFRKTGFWARKFKRLLLEPLTREETFFFASSIFGAEKRPVPREVLPTIHYYTQGVPFYVRAICDRTLTLAKRAEVAVAQSTVNKAFVLEVLREDGLINAVCHSMYFDSLASVSGENSLRAVLQVLAAQEGLNLADVGRRIGRPNGQVHGYLKALLEADLLLLDGKRYFYRDPLLRFFISQNMFNNFENLERQNKRVEHLAKRFFEEFIIKRPDLGFGLEFRVKVLSSFFDGRRIDGKPFGSPVPITLADGHENTVLIDMDQACEVNDEPGLVVSDLCLRGRRRWMVEISRSEDLVELADLERIVRKRKFFESRTRSVFDRVWVISSIGFTEECREAAKEMRILLSEVDDDLPVIEKVVLQEKAA